MARKNNIRSMRFSDDVIEMIESQQGRNFSEKFENLVTRCMWELPEKERRISELDKQILKKKETLSKLSWDLESKLDAAYQEAIILEAKIHAIGKDM